MPRASATARHGLRPDRRAAADPRDRAGLHRQGDRRRARARTTATTTSTPSSWRKIADQGYLGAIVPREYGGAGLDYVTYAIIVEEVGRGDSAMRTVVSVQTSLVCSSILRWGSEEQKQQLPAEALLGRVARLLRADRARHRLGRRQPEDARAQDRRRLVHQRRQDVDLARQPRQGRADLRPDRPRARRTAGSPASSSRPTRPGSATRRSTARWACTAPTRRRSSLDDVEVPDDALLGEVGDGFKIAMSALDSGRYSVAAGCVGVCQGSLDASVAYAKEREQFGRPIAAFQLVQAMIAEHAGADRRGAAARVPRRLAQGPGPPDRRPRPRSRSSTRPRRRRPARTSRSRSTAARATSTTTRSSATTATCA